MSVPFDRAADAYDTTRSLPDEVMGPVLDAIENALGDCPTVIDVGVGTGRFARPLSERGFEVLGVDISRPMMTKAKEKGMRNLVRADAHWLPFTNRAFDAAVMVHLLYHVHDWKKVVREVGRVSKKKVVSPVGDVEGFSARRSYIDLREEMGYPWKRFQEGERGLCKVVSPSVRTRIVERSTQVRADERIAELAGGSFAISWDIPEEIHQAILQRLRSSFGGKVLARRDIFELAVWKPEQLLSVK